MDEAEKFARKTATQCQLLGKSLGDSQSDGRNLTGKEITRLVNTLLNAGNQLEVFVKEKWPNSPGLLEPVKFEDNG